jgi:hypothetical protein
MKLFPQLPLGLGRSIAAELATATLDELRARATTAHPAAIFTATGGDRVEPQLLAKLRTQLLDCAIECGYPGGREDSSGPDFDKLATKFILAAMDTEPCEAAKPGVWSFLGCIVAPDIVRWRFPGKSEGTPTERFLGGARNVLQRIWWRAYLLGDTKVEAKGSVKPVLDVLGEDELVQILERPSLAGSRSLTSALAVTFLKLIHVSGERNRMLLMREAQKRVMRLSSFVTFEALDEDALERMLEELFRQTRAALA